MTRDNMRDHKFYKQSDFWRPIQINLFNNRNLVSAVHICERTMHRRNDAEDHSSVGRSLGKIERLIDEYDLTGIGNELARSWTNDEGERRSLRDLAEYFNTRLLQATMDEAKMTTLDGEVSNAYRLLTADDVSVGDRTQIETTLERNGVDPDQLRQNFVSHQAVHTYLTKHRGVEHSSEPSAQNAVENTQNTIQRLKSRLVAVAENRLITLRDAGTITLGTFSVLVDVRVFCEDCGAHIDISTLLNEDGCDCDPK